MTKNESDDIIQRLMASEWVEADLVQEALSLSFSECCRKFELCRTAEWWSIVGKMDEERSRNGLKITCFFRDSKDMN